MRFIASYIIVYSQRNLNDTILCYTYNRIIYIYQDTYDVLAVLPWYIPCQHACITTALMHLFIWSYESYASPQNPSAGLAASKLSFYRIYAPLTHHHSIYYHVLFSIMLCMCQTSFYKLYFCFLSVPIYHLLLSAAQVHINPLTAGDPIPREQGQYRGCWWSDDFRRQVISSHGIDYLG